MESTIDSSVNSESTKSAESGSAPEIKRRSRVVKAISGVGSAYKFAWYSCLGTAVTVEERLVDFSKKMAVKGASVDIKPSIISRTFDAPKAKITHASSELKYKAQEKITDVEQALDEGVNRSLHFIGVPSRKDMDQMTCLMKDMADSITELSSQLQSQKTVSASSSRAKKPKSEGQASVA
mgnify:CR=1 FL=1